MLFNAMEELKDAMEIAEVIESRQVGEKISHENHMEQSHESQGCM